MSKNIYKETLSNITVSQEALSKALETARNFKEDKVMKTHKIIKFRATATIAASLAVVIALSAVFFGYMGRNSFTLTAYAAEINDEAYVSIGEFEQQNSGSIMYDPEKKCINISGKYHFFVNCEGNNVESITYTANNCAFMVNENFDGAIDKIEIDETINMYQNAYSTDLYSSYTVDYDKQPSLEKYENIDRSEIYYDGNDTMEEKREKYYSLLPPVVLVFSVSMEKETEPTEDEFFDYLDSMYMVYEEILKNPEKYTIDITVNYKNGDTETQTIQFSCEKNPDAIDGYNLTAKIN